MTTLEKPLLNDEEVITSPNVELKVRKDYGSNDPFEVLTNDISFCTKVRLLLWKNIKIQCLRRPKSCFAKCFVPFFVMLIMVFLTLIPDLVTNNTDAYGLEFDYIISNTGDSLDSTFNYPINGYLPFPDSNSNANQWIKYIVCDPNRAQEEDGKDINPPSYLAIVAEDYETNEALQSLLNILQSNYGDSLSEYEFVNNAVQENTWYSYQYYVNQSSGSSTTTTATPTNSSISNLELLTGLDDPLSTASFSSTSLPQETAPNGDEFVYTNCILDSANTTFLNFTEGSLLKFFNTEQELEDYIGSTEYGDTGYNFNNDNPDATRPIGAAIIFNSLGDNNGSQWEYTLRFNSSVIPTTDTKIDIFQRNIDQLFGTSVFQYIALSGFIQLQTWIDHAIMQFMVNATTDVTMQQLYQQVNEYSKGVFMFPTKGYDEDDYWTFFGGAFPFFLFIMFCYPIITVLSILVEEKQSKIKEGMKMMGATTSAYWLSWFIWFFMEFTMIAIFVSVLGFGGGVFKYSKAAIIFVWFELFCLSSATFGMMISTLFDNPKSGSLFGLIAFFAVLIGGQFSASLDESGKTGLCVLAPACFVTSIDALVQYESSTIGLDWDNINDTYNDFKFVTCLQMMAIDIIIYSLLTLYLDQVWPSRYGQKQPFWYILLPSYWMSKCNGCKTKEDSQKENLTLMRRLSEINEVENYEKVNASQYGDSVISIRNLTKTFKSMGLIGTRKEVRAVKGISMDMYRGEVFCLLGHNGAGKTTTIGMLTGLLQVTEGNAWILQNDVTSPSAMSEVRRHLGVCPQHDVLWPRLTTREHLWLFARLKGVPSNRVNDEVEKILARTGLAADNNNDKFPPAMSGGQRRKLSLGIALIGGSQIVFLDEPTSGMDPQSRRITWDLISKEKRNRCIDEADILGDRIAIMGGGQIKCCGSALYLKQSYGVGYTFTVSLEANDDIAKDIDNIKNQVDKFVFDTIENAQSVALAGSELTYRLPFEQTSSFSKLFDTLDENKERLSIKSYGISVTTLEEVFLKIGHDEIDDEADYGKDVKGGQIGMNAGDKLETQNQFAQPTVSTFALQDQNAFQIFFIHVYAVLYKRFWWSLRDFRALLCSLFCPVALSAMALGLLTIQVTPNEPNIELSTTEWYDSVDDVVIPVTNNTGPFPDGTYYEIPGNFYDDNMSFYNSFVNYSQSTVGTLELVPININVSEVFQINTTDYSNDTLKNKFPFEQVFGGPNISVGVYPSYYNITKTFQDWLLTDAYDDNKPHYNAFLFQPYSMTPNTQKHVYFGVNGSAYHALPITVNIWNNWILRDLLKSSEPTIKANSHPLPATERQNLFSSQITGFAQSTYLVIAFSFIPAGAIYFIVNEKTQLTKHQQLVSGISFSAYWVSNFIADFLIGVPASLLVFASCFVFDATAFQGAAAGPFLLVLLLFVFASLPFVYLMSHLFKSPAKAQLTTILSFIIFGIILGTVSFFLDVIPSTQDTNASLKPFYRIFPVFLMTEAFFNISEKQLAANADKSYFDWDVCSRNYVLMTIEGVGYFAAVLLLEYLSTFPALLAKLGFVTDRPLTETDDDLDVDVLEEKQRIKSGIIQQGDNVSIDKNKLDDAVVIAGLRKVYAPPYANKLMPCCGYVDDNDKIEAVKNLHFGVKQSEVFGFLGVNGAGKTTTLATLTGERYPSSGQAFIANFPISNQLQCRRYVGYCPQFDAIFELLTAKEHLKFYAMIKGLKGSEADEQVKVLLNALTLNKYKNRTAGTYSGGNKRKLSVAVSMIGNPPVIFLDEPSTGMDPVSRRHMWEFISTTMAGRCVILTTHSMEECEALCNRVGIMVNGQLKCIGTAQHLKSRYGKGYQLDITLTQECSNNDDEKEKEQDIESLQNELSKNFGQTTLIEHNGSRISYELIKDEDQLKLGAMFNILEEMKTSETFKGIIQAYALSQTTLEQIFIRLAKQGEQDRDNGNDDVNGK